MSQLPTQLEVTRDRIAYSDLRDGQRSDDSSSDCSSLPESLDPKEIARDLKIDTECLMDLDPLFTCPIIEVQPEKPARETLVAEWRPEKAYCERIVQRFPRADRDLVERLGTANWLRFLRCKGEREADEREHPGEDADNVKQPFAPAATMVGSSQFYDSGIGSSIPTLRYAETVMSYSGGNGNHVRIPPLPEIAKKEQPFECIVRGKSLTITSNSVWKRHLFADLQPYLCLETNCSLGNRSFQSRGDWISHLSLNHGFNGGCKGFDCQLCYERIADGKLAVTNHLSRHLEEISLAVITSNAEPDSEDSSVNTETVPFGVDIDSDDGEIAVPPTSTRATAEITVSGQSEIDDWVITVLGVKFPPKLKVCDTV